MTLSKPTELYIPQRLNFNVHKFKDQAGCLGDDRMQTITNESNYVTNEPHNHTEENKEERN